MKKNILFIIPTLKSGGAEKSLVTLLQLFDYEKYNVSLFVFRKEGLFLENVPEQVKILDAGENFKTFDGDPIKAIKTFIKKGRVDLAFARIFYGRQLRNKNYYVNETRSWHWLKKSIRFPEEHFDCVIGYLEGMADWFASEFDAAKKIGYLHTYLDKCYLNKEHFVEVFNKFDSFVTVSDECRENVKKYTSDDEKIHVIHNIISPTFIKKVSVGEGLPDTDKIKILTVGRIVEVKGLDFAVDACKILKDKGYGFKWYHVGVGPEKEKLEKRIADNGLEDTFIFLGEKANPYPFFNTCDIYVQPSKVEGKSIAIDEAKCFNKPIVVTNFPSVYDQIEDGVNGLICEMSAQSVAEKTEMLILNPDLREKLIANLKNEEVGNEGEIQNLYDLIEK